MKKCLLIVALAAISSAAMAQSKKEAVTFGVNAGINISSITVKDAQSGMSASFDSKVGFMAGVFANIPFAEKFSFFPSVNFSQKGLSLTELDGLLKIKQTLNYIDIPLAVKFQPIANLDLFAGPQVSLYLSNDTKVTSTSSKTTATADANDDFKTLDLGLVTGVGYNFSKFNVSARFCPGLTNISKNVDSSEGSVKINTFQFVVGYRF